MYCVAGSQMSDAPSPQPTGALVTEEVRRRIGMESRPRTVTVTAEHIAAYAQAVMWPNPPDPLFSDLHAAARGRHKGVIASPTFGTGMRDGQDEVMDLPLPPHRAALLKRMEFIARAPIRPGDAITWVSRLADVVERGHRVELVVDRDFHNQRGELVLTVRSTLVRLYR